MSNPRYKVGLAVSGGADSVALLVLMSELRKEHGFDAVALHFDHGIRRDSADDADFVRRLAGRFGLPFHSARVKVVRKKGESIDLTLDNIAIYERPIKVYEGNDLQVKGGKIYINGEEAQSYRFAQDVKSQLGQKLGADFSDVRIHTGAVAASKADSIGAKAYTQGRDVYLGSGGYDATTAAHELVHTVQQGVVAGTGVTEAVPVGTVQMKPWGIFSKIKNFFSGKSKKNPNMLKKGAFNDRFNDMDNETKLDELTKLGSYLSARRELNTDKDDDFADYNNTYLSVLQQASADKDFRDLMYQRASASGDQLYKDTMDYNATNYTDEIFHGSNKDVENFKNKRVGDVAYSQNATNFKALSKMLDDGRDHALNGNQRHDLTMQGSSVTDPRADARRNVYRGRDALNGLYLDNIKGNADQLREKNNAIVAGYQLPGGPPQTGKRKRRK